MTRTPTINPDIGYADRFAREHAPKSLLELLAIASALLDQDQELERCTSRFTVAERDQSIEIALCGEQSSLRTLAECASTHGGVITAHPHTDTDGVTVIHCEVHFPYHGVQVEAYAFVPRAA